MPTPRLFSTSARVHPPTVLYLHTTTRISRRWMPAAALLVGVGK
jgi:hypothetical protein